MRKRRRSRKQCSGLEAVCGSGRAKTIIRLNERINGEIIPLFWPPFLRPTQPYLHFCPFFSWPRWMAHMALSGVHHFSKYHMGYAANCPEEWQFYGLVMFLDMDLINCPFNFPPLADSTTLCPCGECSMQAVKGIGRGILLWRRDVVCIAFVEIFHKIRLTHKCDYPSSRRTSLT